MRDETASSSEYRYFTTESLATYLVVAPAKIRAWVATGELPAVNVATNRSGRPRYRFDPVDVELFLTRRRTGGEQSARPPPPRRKRPATDVIRFF